MPKAVSPVRLQQDLMQRATLTGARHQRSAAEQIEYWAALGQQVAGILDPDKLLDVLTGLAAIKVVPIATSAVDPEQVRDQPPGSTSPDRSHYSCRRKLNSRER